MATTNNNPRGSASRAADKATEAPAVPAEEVAEEVALTATSTGKPRPVAVRLVAGPRHPRWQQGESKVVKCETTSSALNMAAQGLRGKGSRRGWYSAAEVETPRGWARVVVAEGQNGQQVARLMLPAAAAEPAKG